MYTDNTDRETITKILQFLDTVDELSTELRTTEELTESGYDRGGSSFTTARA